MARETLVSIIENSQRLHNQLASALEIITYDDTGQYRFFLKMGLDIAPTTPSARSFKDVEMLGTILIDMDTNRTKRLDHLLVYRLFTDTVAHVSNIGGTSCVRLLNGLDQVIALYYIGTTPDYSNQFLKNLSHIIVCSREVDVEENGRRKRSRLNIDID